mmetsp:Transcript_113348/g.366666  ORF Transcript_113348/g.366666 Transcript_113348/m.366666 type:complete len:298 (-) Transcript_113348:1237-2130(-)
MRYPQQLHQHMHREQPPRARPLTSLPGQRREAAHRGPEQRRVKPARSAPQEQQEVHQNARRSPARYVELLAAALCRTLYSSILWRIQDRHHGHELGNGGMEQARADELGVFSRRQEANQCHTARVTQERAIVGCSVADASHDQKGQACDVGQSLGSEPCQGRGCDRDGRKCPHSRVRVPQRCVPRHGRPQSPLRIAQAHLISEIARRRPQGGERGCRENRPRGFFLASPRLGEAHLHDPLQALGRAHAIQRRVLPRTQEHQRCHRQRTRQGDLAARNSSGFESTYNLVCRSRINRAC